MVCNCHVDSKSTQNCNDISRFNKHWHFGTIIIKPNWHPDSEYVQESNVTSNWASKFIIFVGKY